MESQNPGRELYAWAIRNGLSIREVAHMLEVNPRRMCLWKNGKAKPNMEHAVAIEVLTNGYVKVEHWGGMVARVAEAMRERMRAGEAA